MADSDAIRNLTIILKNSTRPSHEDLLEAANVMTRLKNIYKLNVTELADGKLNGVGYSLPMSSGDCYEMGRVLYHSKKYKDALLWMKEALRKYEEEDNDTYSFTVLDIMDYISNSYYLLRDKKNALIWTNHLLAKDSNYTSALNGFISENYITKEEEVDDMLDSDEDGEVNGLVPSLCRGEYDISPAFSKRLTCFFMTTHHAFLRLAPIKAEQLYTNPDVFMFYDVISDKEIQHVKYLAKPKLRNALVYDQATGKLVESQVRISKSAFLMEDNVTSQISRRVSDLTGLTIDTAEPLQVANYGIGGHYVSHYDFDRKHEYALKSTTQGNRIATVLFYMSEVELGGATVFPILGLSVFPIKNAALFWMNLHPSGEGDLSTAHAACPVLLGSKWVCNKWIRIVGQEFRRPCTLEYQPEDINDQHFPTLVPKTLK